MAEEKRRTSSELTNAFAMEADWSRNQRNFVRKAVFDHAVQVVSLRCVGLTLAEVAERVRGRLEREGAAETLEPEVRGYFAEAVVLLDLVVEAG